MRSYTCLLCLVVLWPFTMTRADEKHSMNHLWAKAEADFNAAHTVWPSRRVLDSHAGDPSQIAPDVDELRQQLCRWLRLEYQPSKAQCARAVAVCNYMAERDDLPENVRDADYLMFEYETASHHSVLIQAGTTMNISITNGTMKDLFFADSTNAVVSMVRNVLSFPGACKRGGALNVLTVMECDDSKEVVLSWSGEEKGEYIFSCWSDGTRFLFNLPRSGYYTEASQPPFRLRYRREGKEGKRATYNGSGMIKSPQATNEVAR